MYMKQFNKQLINETASILKSGGLIAFPTETVFGFGVVFDNENSYKRLIDVKRRPPEKPFTLMCADVEDVEKYALTDDRSQKLIKRFMPGQFTIILDAKDVLPSYCVSKENKVGIRIPNDEFVRDLIRKTGKPLLVPSANKSGEPPINNSDEIVRQFENEIDGVIIGEANSKVPSTIVLVDKDIQVIREGLITKEEIFKALEE